MKPFKIVTIAALAVATLLGGGIALGSWYTVDQTERGVILRTGAVTGVAQPGLHWKLPFLDSVDRIRVSDQLLRWDKLEGYSHDQQAAHYKVSVGYKFEPGRVTEIYSTYGGADGAVARLLTPAVLKESKTIIGKFTAQSTIQERARLNAEMTDAIQKAITGPVTITGVNVEDIKFSANYERSIEERMLAEVEVTKLRQNAEREKVSAQITVTKASAAADAARKAAEAEAAAITLRGQAEADAIKARGAALRDNPNLIDLVKAERWDGKLPATMVPGSALPMVNIGAK